MLHTEVQLEACSKTYKAFTAKIHLHIDVFSKHQYAEYLVSKGSFLVVSVFESILTDFSHRNVTLKRKGIDW